MTVEARVKSAKAVLDKVAIRDETGVVHPRGLVVEVQAGRIVFYRDVTHEVLIREHEGWAIEMGVLVYCRERGIEKVHYRVVDGPLYSASLAVIEESGIEYDRNQRHQVVLPLRCWTKYAPDLAYAVPQSDKPWRVVDHRTGAVDGEEETEIERLDREVAIEMMGFDAPRQAARFALERLRHADEEGALAATESRVVEDLYVALSWLMAREEERVAQEDGR